MRHPISTFGEALLPPPTGSCSLSLWERVGVRARGRRLVRCCWFEAGAGASSPQPSHFLLLRQKKVTKEKATPLAATLRFAAGNLRCSLFAGSAQTRLRLKHARPFIREKLRSSAQPEGTWNSTRRGAYLCGVQANVSFGSSLTLTLAHTHTHTHTHTHMLTVDRRRTHPFQASRSEAAVGRAKQWPDRSPIPSARAEERSFRRIKGRACLSEASLRGPRLKRAPQVARSEAEGRAQWGRLFFGYFLLATQKKVTRPPGRTPGSSLNTTATYESSARCPHPNPLPEGEGEREGARPQARNAREMTQ